MANQETKKGGRAALILIIVLLVLVAGGASFYFLKYKPDQEAKEKARLEQIAREEAEKKARELEAQKQANYDDLINNADVEFQNENWEAAKAMYAEASTLYPDQNYPQGQIALIDAKLAELAAIEAAKPGTIESISSRTGKYYVILSSSIDDDLAMDYAVKLSKEKINVTILKTTDKKHTYFAVSPANFDTYAEAEAAMDNFSSYGSGLWVLKF